jgi:hypothetical protein
MRCLEARVENHQYPPNWEEIAKWVKDNAGWRCELCKHPHEPNAGYTLTVDHLDFNPANCDYENLAALCQRCHLKRQGLRCPPRTREELFKRMRPGTQLSLEV